MSNIFDTLKSISNDLGLNPSNENNGGTNVYLPKFFDGVDVRKQKSIRKKLRDNYVLPLLQSIANCKDKEEFNKKKNSFLKLYLEIFISDGETFDFKVFGMLRNNNAILAQKAQKIWENFSK